MNKSWLSKKGCKTCILFFNGWGMDENAINHLATGNTDICMFNNYSSISSIDEELNEYDTIYLVAWSLGVWASSIILKHFKFKISKAIALNGTNNPIDLHQGIPPSIFSATLENWNERNRNKFNLRMLGGLEQYTLFNHRISVRNIEDQKNELSNIEKIIKENRKNEIKFDCALIGNNDLIFSPINQLSYWNSMARIVKVDSPHYPFNNFMSWNEIIEL